MHRYTPAIPVQTNQSPLDQNGIWMPQDAVITGVEGVNFLKEEHADV